MNSRRIIAILIGLLLATFGITSSAAVAAKAATTVPAHQATVMGVTSSGRIFNLAKPPSWLNRIPSFADSIINRQINFWRMLKSAARMNSVLMTGTDKHSLEIGR